MSTAWGERLDKLHESRKLLYTLPVDQLHELPGRPNVVFSIKDYREDKVQGALECRSDMPFLFKASETGQIGPRRLSRLVGDKPRNATIHEYLDWTVTGVEAKQEGEYVSAATAWRPAMLSRQCYSQLYKWRQNQRQGSTGVRHSCKRMKQFASTL
jgi:hypothetical protein